MRQNAHLISNEQNALQVSGYVSEYASRNFETQFGERPLPCDVEQVASDFCTDLAHYVSLNGGDVSDVLSKAFQNYLEEISGGNAPEEIIDRFRALVDDAIYATTIGPVAAT